jgi:hypothetical protein
MENASASDKAGQLERDFGVHHPRKALPAGLRRRDDYHEVTPFHAAVGRDRLAGLGERGYDVVDSCIVLLMRGARVETLAKATGEGVEELVEEIRARLKLQPWSGTLEPMVAESQRNLNLWRRA